MNFLDRAIGAISPKAAAERLYWRTVIDEARGFDAARLDRRTRGWQATGTSANAEAASGLDRLRFRCRELERNNAYAAAIFRRLPSHMVGGGITPRISGKRISKRVRDNWWKFVSTSDRHTRTSFNAQLWLACRAIVRDGEVLLVWRDTPDVDAPIAVDVLEADHLDTGKTEARGDATIIQGVEFNADGERVAYWLFDHHPGEVVSRSATRWQSRRVDATRVDHVFDVLRPGQARGIPWLAPVALKMRDIAEYEDAELIRKKIEACFTAFVKKIDEGAGTIAQSSKEKETGRRIERISPGLIHYLGVNEDVQFGSPQSSAGIGEYLRVQSQSAAAGAGVTYSMMTGDLSQANYSSMRAGKLDFWLDLDHWQWDMIVPMILAPAWRRVHQAFARVGKGPRDVPPCDWSMPPRPMVDPDKDGKAIERDLRLGRKTWPQMVAETGEDPEEQAEEVEKWSPRLKAAGVDFGAKSAGDATAPVDDNGDANDTAQD
ncbi:phage portal protein [Amorphus sp. 3PC139-8]|uniref:phage portal protein n=1 Tax=Amorphus sp. 3PC139-8 TaxID=2735676 RepID=UPI00345D28E4